MSRSPYTGTRIRSSGSRSTRWRMSSSIIWNASILYVRARAYLDHRERAPSLERSLNLGLTYLLIEETVQQELVVVVVQEISQMAPQLKDPLLVREFQTILTHLPIRDQELCLNLLQVQLGHRTVSDLLLATNKKPIPPYQSPNQSCQQRSEFQMCQNPCLCISVWLTLWKSQANQRSSS
jgi:hypothetical protein